MFVKTIRTLLSLFGNLSEPVGIHPGYSKPFRASWNPSELFETHQTAQTFQSLKGKLVQPDWLRGWFQPNVGTAPSLHR